eukprot:gb/GECG01006475.1/.p1 GENE.gb/GECG01006475.1/~~gb/GECG01006475.1/.p1  ORF type:complete len:750 (+),score=76.97 gb/GECG01006475.1/:1-2250(+)
MIPFMNDEKNLKKGMLTILLLSVLVLAPLVQRRSVETGGMRADVRVEKAADWTKRPIYHPRRRQPSSSDTSRTTQTSSEREMGLAHSLDSLAMLNGNREVHHIQDMSRRLSPASRDSNLTDCGREYCATAEYHPFVEFDEAIPGSTSGEINLTVQSANGEEPSFYFTCNTGNFEATKGLYFACDPRYDGTGLAVGPPVVPSSRVANITTCGSASNDCREYHYRVSVALKKDIEDLISRHYAIHEENDELSEWEMESILVPTSMNVALDGEAIAQVNQNITINASNVVPKSSVTNAEHASSVAPNPLELYFTRREGTHGKIWKPIVLTVASNTHVRWATREDISGFVHVPFEEMYQEAGVAVVETNVSVETDKAPERRTHSMLFVSFFDQVGAHLKDVLVEFVLTVKQANVDVEAHSLNVYQSLSENTLSRSFMLYNFGTANMSWNMTVFWSDGSRTNITNQFLWIPKDSGSVRPSNKENVWLQFSKETATSESSSAWLLVETDAWSSLRLPVDSSFQREFSLWNSTELSSVHFWVYIRYTRSSVFLCRDYPQTITLEPGQRSAYNLSVVNMGDEDMQLKISRVMLQPTDVAVTTVQGVESSTGNRLNSPTELALNSSQDNGLRLANWMVITPQSFPLRRREIRHMKILLKYPDVSLTVPTLESNDPELVRPGAYRVVLNFEGQFPSDSNTDSFEEQVTFAHVPGRVSPSDSTVSIIGSENVRAQRSQAPRCVRKLSNPGSAPHFRLFSL